MRQDARRLATCDGWRWDNAAIPRWPTVLDQARRPLAPVVRLVLQFEVTAGGGCISLWAGALACMATGGVAILLWRESTP